MLFEALTSHGLISTVRHFFIIILPGKVHYLFSYFEKSGKKVGHPQKSCLTPPLGGGGVHTDYFVKLDFEIAVDQQTRARDRTFEEVPDSR